MAPNRLLLFKRSDVINKMTVFTASSSSSGESDVLPVTPPYKYVGGVFHTGRTAGEVFITGRTAGQIIG